MGITYVYISKFTTEQHIPFEFKKKSSAVNLLYKQLFLQNISVYDSNDNAILKSLVTLYGLWW